MQKHGCRIALIALACLGWALPAGAAELDRYLPSDTEFVLTVNARQIIDSELIKQYALEAVKAALRDSEVKKVLEPLGFDPLTDIGSVAIASPGGDDKDKGLLIVHGKFDVAKVTAKADEVAKDTEQLKVLKEGGYRLYEVAIPGQDAKTMYVALVDEKTLVVSPGKSYVVGALDMHAGKKESAPRKELKDLVAKVDGRQSVWLVALGSGLGKSAFAKDDKAKELLEKCESFSTGLTITRDIKVDAHIAARNADSAGDLKKQLSEGIDQAKTLVTILATQQPEIAPLGEVLNALKVSADGSSVLLKGLITAELIESAMKRGN